MVKKLGKNCKTTKDCTEASPDAESWDEFWRSSRRKKKRRKTMTVAESKERKRKREDARTKTNCHGASQDETSETIQSDMIEWEEFKRRHWEADDEMRAVAQKLFDPKFHPSIFLRECRDN